MRALRFVLFIEATSITMNTFLENVFEYLVDDVHVFKSSRVLAEEFKTSMDIFQFNMQRMKSIGGDFTLGSHECKELKSMYGLVRFVNAIAEMYIAEKKNDIIGGTTMLLFCAFFEQIIKTLFNENNNNQQQQQQQQPIEPQFVYTVFEKYMKEHFESDIMTFLIPNTIYPGHSLTTVYVVHHVVEKMKEIMQKK